MKWNVRAGRDKWVLIQKRCRCTSCERERENIKEEMLEVQVQSELITETTHRPGEKARINFHCHIHGLLLRYGSIVENVAALYFKCLTCNQTHTLHNCQSGCVTLEQYYYKFVRTFVKPVEWAGVTPEM